MNVLQRIIVPQESVNDQSLVVLELNFKTGDRVSKGSMIAELETSKTTIAVEADADGFITYFCNVGDDLLVNALIAEITDEAQVAPGVVVPHSNGITLPVAQDHLLLKVEETIFSSDAIKALDEFGLTKEVFAGKDFVTRRDIETFKGVSKPDPQKVFNQVKPSVVNTVAVDESSIELKKISSIKSKEIRFLADVQSAGLVSVINTSIETTGLTEFLNQHFVYFKDSLLPIIIFESARLLRKHPLLNAFYNQDSIAVYKKVNIGFAVDIEKGLKVLKIADADVKNAKDIESEIFSLSNAYLDEKLKTESLTDITFTVTDLSGESVSSFTPLVNMRNSAILGIGSIDRKLQRCYVSLAFDHRVTEGRQAAIFLAELKGRVESYYAPALNADVRNNIVAGIRCYRCQKTLRDDLSSVGFARCITPSGDEGYICQSCFKGF